MTRTEFIKECAARTGVSIKDMKEVLAVAGEVIVENMKDEEGVAPFQGFKFCATFKEAHTARSPITGEQIVVPAKYVPKVKFGKAVKEGINE